MLLGSSVVVVVVVVVVVAMMKLDMMYFLKVRLFEILALYKGWVLWTETKRKFIINESLVSLRRAQTRNSKNLHLKFYAIDYRFLTTNFKALYIFCRF